MDNTKAYQNTMELSKTTQHLELLLTPTKLRVQINHQKLDHQVEATMQGHLAEVTTINP